VAHYLLHTGQPSARRLLRRVNGLLSYRSASGLDNGDVVIRWGVTSEADPFPARVMNPRDAVLRTQSRTKMFRLLRQIGFRCLARGADSSTGPSLLRQYRIPLFDLRPLACFRSDASGIWINRRIQRLQDSFQEVALDQDRVTVRAVNLAMRAAHALGLDVALVSVGMAAKGVLYLMDITPNPILEDRMLDLYADAIACHIEEEAEWASGTQQVQPVLGTDVELMLRNRQGKMVLASKYFPRHGRVGCDDRSLRSDGQRLPLLELRPDPTGNPLELVEHLRETMLDAATGIRRQGVEWRAGSMPFRPYPTGAHIHFSGVPFSAKLVQVLDNYVGLPLMLVEDPKTGQLRRPRYGMLGDVRFKAHGGFEYRTPASFVVDPDVTAAAFCLAYLAALYHRELPVANLSDPNLQLAFYRSDKPVLRSVWERNLAALSRLPMYERYRDHILPLASMIELEQVWDESVDVRKVWQIPLKGVIRKASQAMQASYAVSV
jgi:hypothetical protein